MKVFTDYVSHPMDMADLKAETLRNIDMFVPSVTYAIGRLGKYAFLKYVPEPSQSARTEVKEFLKMNFDLFLQQMAVSLIKLGPKFDRNLLFPIRDMLLNHSDTNGYFADAHMDQEEQYVFFDIVAFNIGDYLIELRRSFGSDVFNMTVYGPGRFGGDFGQYDMTRVWRLIEQLMPCIVFNNKHELFEAIKAKGIDPSEVQVWPILP